MFNFEERELPVSMMAVS